MLSQLDEGINPVAELDDYIKKNRLTRRKFAKLCDVPSATISEILTLKRRPSLDVALRIQEKTNINAINLVVFKEINKLKDQIRKIERSEKET